MTFIVYSYNKWSFKETAVVYSIHYVFSVHCIMGCDKFLFEFRSGKKFVFPNELIYNSSFNLFIFLLPPCPLLFYFNKGKNLYSLVLLASPNLGKPISFLYWFTFIFLFLCCSPVTLFLFLFFQPTSN